MTVFFSCPGNRELRDGLNTNSSFRLSITVSSHEIPQGELLKEKHTKSSPNNPICMIIPWFQELVGNGKAT